MRGLITALALCVAVAASGQIYIDSYRFGAPLDADAKAFLDSAGITDATITQAINTLVLDLKNYGIWTKMVAIYPFVGGTADTHKWNLKDPRNLDAAFRLTFSGTLTHSSNGITGDGATGFADTYINGGNLTTNNTHVSMYSTTDNNQTGADAGFTNSTNSRILFAIKLNNSTFYDFYDTGNGRIAFDMSSTSSKAFFIASRTSSTSFSIYRNATLLTSKSDAVSSTIPTTVNMTLFARRDSSSGVGLYSSRNYAFASIGSGLNSTEAGNLNTAVQAFQTSLSRSN